MNSRVMMIIGFTKIILKIMKSLSEIETTSKRASRAAGFLGIAEEIGKSMRLLELFGLQM